MLVSRLHALALFDFLRLYSFRGMLQPWVVIFKCTSHVCRLKSGRKQKTGTFLKELTQPLGKLLAAGYSVEVRT